MVLWGRLKGRKHGKGRVTKKGRKKGERGSRKERETRVGQNSPKRTGYRTWFYASFVCAYACCPSGRTTPPAPALCRAGSRRDGRPRLRACSSPRARRALSPARGPCLSPAHARGCSPDACSPRSSAGRRACGLWSSCHSSWSAGSCPHAGVRPLSSPAHRWRTGKGISAAGPCVRGTGPGSCPGWPAPKTDTFWCEASGTGERRTSGEVRSSEEPEQGTSRFQQAKFKTS